MKRGILPLLVLGVLGVLTVWLVLSSISPKSGEIMHKDGRDVLGDVPEPPMVATLITDPFFHPAIQPVLPPTHQADPMQGSLSNAAASSRPMQPIIEGPLTVSPSPQPPQPLPGAFPSRPASVQPQVETDSPVRISLQGVVVGDRPAAFLRVNDSPSVKAQAGAQLKEGITVLTISENEVTVSRKGKTLTLKPGQAENL